MMVKISVWYIVTDTYDSMTYILTIVQDMKYVKYT